MDIKCKSSSYELYQQGLLGNKLLTWNSLKEVLSSGFNGTVSMRYKGAHGGGFATYNVRIEDIECVQQKWIKEGAKEELITFNESAPDDKLLIQGELMKDSEYYLFYSCERTKMRDALKNGISAKGLTAKLLLQHFLTPSSYEDIMALLDMYPEHVIEFGAYERCLGNIPGRNTVIWEVRKY